jgi:TonB family protein
MLEQSLQVPFGQPRIRLSASVLAVALHVAIFLSLVAVWHRANLGALVEMAGARSANMPAYVAAPAVPKENPTPIAKPAPAEKPAQVSQTTGTSALTAEAVPEQTGPVRLEAGDQFLLKKLSPPYPPAMLAARIEGVVILDATIRRDGTIGDVKVLKSTSPGFEQAAIGAVKQWRYTPMPYEAIVTVTVNFKLV